MSNWSNTLNGPILMGTGSATGSSDGKAMIFAKSDGKIYVKDSSGTESAVGGGSQGATRTDYVVTTADAENTTSKINLIEVTIPAGSWGDDQAVVVDAIFQIYNQTGTTKYISGFFGGTNITEQSGFFNFNNQASATPFWAHHSFQFIRQGSGLLLELPQASYATNAIRPTAFFSQQHTSVNHQNFVLDTASVDFSVDITLYIAGQLNFASPSLYYRTIWATSYKV